LSRCLCEALAVQILTSDLRDETGVAWNMLRFELVSWTTNPCFTLR
jgi:hypothetical protein